MEKTILMYAAKQAYKEYDQLSAGDIEGYYEAVALGEAVNTAICSIDGLSYEIVEGILGKHLTAALTKYEQVGFVNGFLKAVDILTI